MIINDEYIKEYFWENKFYINTYKLNNITIDILNYLNSRYTDSESILETLNRIKLNIDVHPICPICNKNLVQYRGRLLNKGIFQFTCKDNNCRKQYRSLKNKETCLKKYGVDNGAKTKQSISKSKETCLKKYGVDRPLKSQQIYNKLINTNLEKYGVKNVYQSKLIKDKIKQNSLDKYGVKNPGGSKISIEHIKETKQKRYGNSKYNNTDKANKTKKINNSFNKSNPEDICYNLLKEKFKDVKRQFKSDKYPFNCDFYIPEIDTYIEYNGFWTHGFHPYNKNDTNDINKINEWKEKKSPFYKGAILNWTVRDPLKRKIAKENKLNYFEFFKIDDFRNWIKIY